jgi:UDP:flavonoid glycosyltransferase YjiC (YdhE family)
MARGSLEGMFDDFWNACSGCDAIIGSPSSIVGPQIAAALDTRFCWASLQPMSRTIAFPHFLSPHGFRLGGQANRLSYFFAEQIFWRLFRYPMNQWRQGALKQPLLRHPGPYRLLGDSPYPVLYGFSPSVVHPPRDWSETTQVTGYWFLNRPAGWEPPCPLSSFLNAGPPPVYIGLAGINAADSGGLLRLTIDALTKARVRGLLHVSGSARVPDDLPESVLKIGSVPHDWLFEHVSAVIHHGGAGTTASALRAGVPSMASPVFFDQPFWGRRIASLGVGLNPIPPGKLSAATLASAFRTLTGDRSLRARAAALGRQIRSEDGVGRAVSLLDQYWGQ